MSTIDPTSQPSVVVSPRPIPRADSAPMREQPPVLEPRGIRPDESVRERREPEKPDKAAEVLQHVAKLALQHPPRDIQKLTASATKFLLINLEPALRLAEELREVSLQEPDRSVRDMAPGDRQDRVLALLTDARV